MDLLQTVRKEGSRGGVNFSWDDVKNSAHRENYLGHSIKAPVGRWQKGKDLSWYAKADDAHLTAEEREEIERERKREELRKIKEAEEDAMAKALGLPVPDRTNANLQPLVMDRTKQGEMNQALREALKDDDATERSSKEQKRSHHDRVERRRNRSRSRDEERRRRHDDHDRRRNRSGSARGERRRHRSRSRDRRTGDDDHRPSRTERRRSREFPKRSDDRYNRRDEDTVARDKARNDRSSGVKEQNRRNDRRSRSRSPYRRHDDGRRYWR